MYRMMVAIAALAGSAAAFAAPPEIAYSVRGSGSIYIVNPDGTGKRQIYRAPPRKDVFAISFRSGGGEIAFEEVDSTGQTGRLRTVEFGTSGAGTVTRTIEGCRFDVDFHPTDGSLLFVEIGNLSTCGQGDIKRLAPGSSTPVSLGIQKQASKVAWLADGSTIIFAAEGKIWTAPANGSTAPEEIVAQNCVSSLEAGHERTEALLTVGSVCGASLDRLVLDPATLDAVTIQWGIASGESPSYSPDDLCFVYIAPAQRGSYLKVRRTQDTGTEVTIGKKANYASVDWRGEPSEPYGCPAAASAVLPDR